MSRMRDEFIAAKKGWIITGENEVMVKDEENVFDNIMNWMLLAQVEQSPLRLYPPFPSKVICVRYSGCVVYHIV